MRHLSHFFDVFAIGPCSTDTYDSFIDERPFLEYAAFYWKYRLKDFDESLSTDIVLGFARCSRNFKFFQQILQRKGTSDPDEIPVYFGNSDSDGGEEGKIYAIPLHATQYSPPGNLVS